MIGRNRWDRHGECWDSRWRWPEILALAAAPALGADIYWANFGSGGVGTDTLDGNPGNVNQGFIPAGNASGPTGVTVDSKFIYWTNFAGNSIGRANLDGSSPNTTFISGPHVSNPNAVFVAGGFIYWANYGSGTIVRDTIDGNSANIVDLVSGQNHPSGLAADTSHLYWSVGDGAGSTIGRANLDGSSQAPNFISSGTARSESRSLVASSIGRTGTGARSSATRPTAIQARSSRSSPGWMNRPASR